MYFLPAVSLAIERKYQREEAKQVTGRRAHAAWRSQCHKDQAWAQKKIWLVESSSLQQILHLEAMEKPGRWRRYSVGVLLSMGRHPKQLNLLREITFQIRLGHWSLGPLDLMVFQANFKESWPSGAPFQLNRQGKRLEAARMSWFWIASSRWEGTCQERRWKREAKHWSRGKCRCWTSVEKGLSPLQVSCQTLMSWPFPKDQTLPWWWWWAKRRILFQIH